MASIAKLLPVAVDKLSSKTASDGGNLACLWAVRHLIWFRLDRWGTKSDLTTDFDNALKASFGGSKSESSVPAGGIIISPSQWVNGKKRTGHVANEINGACLFPIKPRPTSRSTGRIHMRDFHYPCTPQRGSRSIHRVINVNTNDLSDPGQRRRERRSCATNARGASPEFPPAAIMAYRRRRLVNAQSLVMHQLRRRMPLCAPLAPRAIVDAAPILHLGDFGRDAGPTVWFVKVLILFRFDVSRHSVAW